jgi:uncharacterized LabA/DUF88 family protein
VVISAPPYFGPREVHYLFVDGGALRGRIKNLSDRFFGCVNLDINFEAMVGSFTKVFYYDALPVRNQGESEIDFDIRTKPSRAVLDAAASVDRVHVYEGDARRRRRQGLIQKKVDVMLTVDMLTHAFRKNMHQATLLTGDNDFKPLIDALVQDGMFVTLWYPQQETSRELMQAADARRPLNMSILHSLLTPESQNLFQIPCPKNQNPSIEPGQILTTWVHDSKALGLYRDGSEFVVTQEHDALNRLHIRHANYELLRFFCHETLDIELPERPP